MLPKGDCLASLLFTHTESKSKVHRNIKDKQNEQERCRIY